MKYVIIDGNIVESMDDIHKIFAKELDFPDYYGKNLDALYDCLCESNCEAAVIMIEIELLEENLGDSKMEALAETIEDAVSYNPNIRFYIAD